LKPVYALVIGLILLGVGVVLQMGQVKPNPAEPKKEQALADQPSPNATTSAVQKYALRSVAVKGRVLRSVMKMDIPDASLSVEAAGKYITGGGTASLETTERMEVIAVEGGRASVLRQRILGDTRSSTMTFEGKSTTSTEKGPLEGTTLLLELKNGRWVRSLLGNAPNQAQKAELQQQFVDPDEIYPTDKVSPGYKWQLKDQQLVHFFQNALSATGEAWCTFNGVEMRQDRKCAVISSWIQISYKTLVNNNPAEFTVGATGMSYRDLDKLIDIESSMDGQMTMKISAIMNGSKTTVELAGPLHAVKYISDISGQPELGAARRDDLRMATLVCPGGAVFWNN
jgi:hypothetical protein